MLHQIAIQEDFVRQKNGETQSFSARWRELAKECGIAVRTVDVFAPDIAEQLHGCDGFMWRFGYEPRPLDMARRILPAVEHGARIATFPSVATAWHFEDKIAQTYLLSAAGIPTPRTWVFWRLEDALSFCRDAAYPLVLKLSAGIQSNNVRLLHDRDEATFWARQMFGPGLRKLQNSNPLRTRLSGQIEGLRLLLGKARPRNVQHGYFYVQEFLPENEFDTRITVIGDRAYGFRRFNRPDDFRASGSGRIDWNPQAIDEATIRLAFRIARHLGTQSVAIDGLRRGDERVVGEISYTYASWAIRDCPGHWVLHGDPERGSLEWRPGRLRAEDAIFEDFVALLDERHERTQARPRLEHVFASPVIGARRHRPHSPRSW